MKLKISLILPALVLFFIIAALITPDNKELIGRVISQDSNEYSSACTISNQTYEISIIRPKFIIYCNFVQDVINALKWSKREQLPVSIRSGGHGYEGYSMCNGLLIDVSPMNQISLSTDFSFVKVGAGCRLIDIYNKLWNYNRTIVGGSCGTVGISGFTLGGGYGFLSRQYGLAIDQLIELEMVDAAGKVLIANQNQNSDLFWACKGGGGGNFGVVTSFTFKTIPIDQVIYFKITWPWNDVADVVAAWQKWAPATLDKLTSVLIIPTKDKGVIYSTGIFLGTEENLSQLLAENFLKKRGLPSRIEIQRMSWIDAVNKLDTPFSAIKQGFKAKSDYINEPLNKEGINTIVAQLEVKEPKIEKAMLILDSYGGAINRVGEQESAFVHRTDLFSIQYLAYWHAEDEEAAIINRKWIREFYMQMRPYVSGYTYQNYIDSDLPNWLDAYYGINQNRLRKIKMKYDPNNFFNFQQSIPLL